MSYNYDENATQFPNAEDSIVIETADSFTAAVSKGPDGKRSLFSVKPPTRREVVEKFYWNEAEIIRKEVEQGKLAPAFAPSLPDDNEGDYEDESDEGISYDNATLTNRKDEWEQIVGKNPDWSDINDETVKE